MPEFAFAFLDCEFGGLDPELDWKPWLRTFRSVEHQDYKLIEASDGRHELYELTRDPGETTDRAAEDPGRVRLLQRRIEAWAGTFEPYDPSKADPEDRPGRLPPGIEDRLRALGYVE